MHVFTIIAFAAIFWRAEGPGDWPRLVSGTWGVVVAVLGQIPLLAALSWVTGVRTRKILAQSPEAPQIAQHFHHKTTFLFRWMLTGGFVLSVLATPWGEWFNFAQVAPELQILGDLITLAPYFAGAIVLWLTAYPVERAARVGGSLSGAAELPRLSWGLRSYLDFNIRHHLLVVAVPLTIILFGANVIRGRDDAIRQCFGVWWAPDMLLGAVAVAVFLIAPLFLVRIWRTVPIPSGPLRAKLEEVCRRIHLRVRDILVWDSDGLMINAAVMGVVPPVRYVLLSDALLAAMSDKQIEAVFGHEAGHVRHHHILHFLLFAFVGWIAVAGIMELLAYLSLTVEGPRLSLTAIQGIGMVATLTIWGVGFGWLSRRFERQADLFGARSVTPGADECHAPCSVHLDVDSADRPSPGTVCSTGASVFASALERVALLNGIPRDEKSWRHSSIAYRVRFLQSLAGDPHRALRFERVVARAKRTLLIAAIVGAGASLCYWRWAPEPALLRIQAGVSPAKVVSPDSSRG